MSDLPCDCCGPDAPRVGAPIANRPALSAVAYRLGTFATFRQAVLDQLAARLPELRTRRSDDYAITLVELWAAVGDVLTFYQERLANEAFLRTARDRDAVLRLARLIGYQLRPGAASTALLAFTLERGRRLVLPVGLRVQSVPAAGEQPQKYETLQALAADARLDRLAVLPPPTPVHPLAAGRTGTWLAPGDAMLAAAARLAAGDALLLVRSPGGGAPDAVEQLTVRAVSIAGDRAHLAWSPGIRDAGWPPTTTLRRTTRMLSLFGQSAPPRFTGLVTPTSGLPFWRELTTDFAWTTTTGELWLDGVRADVPAGARVLVVDRAGALRTIEAEVLETATLPAPPLRPLPVGGTTSVPDVPLSGTVTRLRVTPATLSFADRRRVELHVLDEPPLRAWPYEHEPLLSAPELWIPGRRRGRDAIEVGRGARAGLAVAGDVVTHAEFTPGRALLLTDDTGATVSAALTSARLAGLDVRVAASAADVTTLGELGLADAAPVTALVSAPLLPVPALSSAVRELTVTIGAHAPQVIRLDGPGADTLPTLRARLQAEIRLALDDAPAFTGTRVVDTGAHDVLLVVPGVPGETIAFGPSARDATTVRELGLDDAQARWIDGLLSTALVPRAALSATAPALEVRLGLLPPRTVALPSALPAPGTLTPSEWVALVAPLLEPLVRGTADDPLAQRARVVAADDRLLLLPGVADAPMAEYLVLDVVPSSPVARAGAAGVRGGHGRRARHGETVRPEVLGDGDASVAFQRFPLAKTPVTHVAAPGDATAPSSLQLLVDGVRWERVPTLYGRGPTEPVYVARLADDGTVTVQTGDGETGARLPSGRGNVVARYRQGLGVAGRVAAGALTTLLDRPQGLRAVVNPLAADGGADPESRGGRGAPAPPPGGARGADPESLADARTNAPDTVRTLGRAVSLADFESIVRASGEVAKAQATWVWTGSGRTIHLTVAGPRGARFSGDALARLRASLDAVRDVNVPLRLGNHLPVAVVVEATLAVDARHVQATVLESARRALLDALGFEASTFAGAVNLSDVYRVLQDVPGVVSVDVDRLHFKDLSPAFLGERGADLAPVQGRLPIRGAQPPAGAHADVRPAELAYVEVPAQDVVLRAVGGLTA